MLDWHIATVFHELDPLTERDGGGKGWVSDVQTKTWVLTILHFSLRFDIKHVLAHEHSRFVTEHFLQIYFWVIVLFRLVLNLAVFVELQQGLGVRLLAKP